MDKQSLLIQGSSWTVGAYQKSDVKSCDDLVPGGIGELASKYFNVTNISVQDDFNLGSSWRLNEHLKTTSYDKIIICQNDALMDVDVLTCDNKEWASNFDFTLFELKVNKINSIQKYIEYVLNKFYSQLPSGTFVFAGPSMVINHLAVANKLVPIQPDWIKCLVPTYQSSFTYSHTKLITLLDILTDLFPENKFKLKEEFLLVNDDIDRMINTWKNNSEYFAYFHPTSLGNKIFFEQILKYLIA